ncbi:MAG: hypothetical protein IPI35_23285 [Deltaproteobacteria bacterium]|nr:hypothetical protein [Deltaproteobacteria bacterium]
MVKPCENEECGKPFIAKRRDTRFCSASCRARAHTLKSRREYLLARTSAAAGVEVDDASDAGDTSDGAAGAAGAGAGGRDRRRSRRGGAGLGELAAELRVGRDQAADVVAELSARVDAEVAAQARRARAAATEGGGGTSGSVRLRRSCCG